MDRNVENKFNQLDRDYRGVESQLDAINAKLHNLEKDIAEIKGTIKPKDLPWAVRFMLIPLAVAAIGGTIGAVIHLEIVVAGIKNGVASIQGEQVKQTLALNAALPANDFKANLPDLSADIAMVRKQKLSVRPQVINSLQQKLIATDPSSTGFWPAAAQLISYRSSLAMPASEVQTILNYPPCRGPADMEGADRNAAAQVMGPDGKPTGPKTHITRIGEQDCAVQLDGKTISGWDCKRCLVKYSGGPLSMRDTRFEDCLFVFEFHPDQPPPPDGRHLSDTLLAASELKNVTVSGI